MADSRRAPLGAGGATGMTARGGVPGALSPDRSFAAGEGDKAGGPSGVATVAVFAARGADGVSDVATFAVTAAG